MSYHLSKTSMANMEGCHPDLIKLAQHTIVRTRHDFGIRETSVRTVQQQVEFLEQGWSTTMNSRHIPENNACGLSCAIDFFAYDKDGNITSSAEYYKRISQDFVTCAIQLGIPIELGALFGTFFDGGHVQLAWTYEPAAQRRR